MTMSAVEQLGVGIIGCGAMGREHAANLLTLPSVRLIALSDPDEAGGRRLAHECDVPYCYSNYSDLLERPDIDAVIIAVPNALHKAVSLAALAANKHVLLEKPLAHNVADGLDIVGAAERSDRVVMLGFHNRFTAEAQALLRAAIAGRLGTVYYTRARWLRRRGLPPRASWFTSMAAAGGGPLIDIGVHMLDLALHLMGYPRPISAFGVACAQFGPARAHAAPPVVGGEAAPADHFDVEDFAAGMVRLANGATVQIETSWASFIGNDEDLGLEILGSAGGARMTNGDGPGLSIFTTLDGEQVDVTPRLPEVDGHREELGAFLAAIRAGTQSPVRLQDGLEVLAIIEAIYESARSGEVVPVRRTR
jgi:predicted dehydrogenase